MIVLCTFPYLQLELKLTNWFDEVSTFNRE